MSQFLASQDSPALETTNTKLAAALLAVGIPLDPKNPVKVLTGDRGDRHGFFFLPVSPCGQYKTAALIQAWDDPDWHRRFPEHPFSYIKCAFDNFERAVDYIRRRVPTAVVARGNKLAFLSLNASDTLQKQIFTKLKE